MSDPTFGDLQVRDLSLFTDLYELKMMQGYVHRGHVPTATFSHFFRSLPPDRGYIVAAGLEQVIEYIETLEFGDVALDYLAELGFEEDFLEYLAGFEFTGDMRAVPEGTVVFPNEPFLEVTGPISEVQLFETLFINQIGFQSLIATKAARMRDVIDEYGDDQSLVDFGSRRAHGIDAGMKAARAAYIGGFTGTSNVAAGRTFDIPVFGTMAHSWVQSFATERDSFEAFVSEYGEESVLLVDTYDTVEGTRTAIEVAEQMGVDIAGIRLDSGDVAALSNQVAEVLPDGMGIFVSSGIDEYEIQSFFEAGGVATGFGPGTALVTSTDAPNLEGVYKLVAVGDGENVEPSMKLSAGKVSHPGRKGIRRIEEDGVFHHDVLTTRDESGTGTNLMIEVYDEGRLVYDVPTLQTIRDCRDQQVASLPLEIRALVEPATYPVEISDRLRSVTESVRGELEDRYLGS